MDKYKQNYISKLDDATKRAVAFLNNLEEGNDRELEKLTLRKLMFTVLKIRNIESYNQVMRYMKWEQHYKNDSHYDEWVKHSTGNDIDFWYDSLYKVAGTIDVDLKVIKPVNRREDLEKLFNVKSGTFNSSILVYEGQNKTLYTVVMYDEPYWGGENHITMRGSSKFYKDPALAQGADRWGSKNWIEHMIAHNPVAVQNELKSYKYVNTILAHFTFAQETVLFRTKEVIFTNDERGL